MIEVAPFKYTCTVLLVLLLMTDSTVLAQSNNGLTVADRTNVPTSARATAETGTGSGDDDPVNSGYDGETIDGTEILSQSVNIDCLDFQIVGVCIWVTYYYFGVDIDYSPKVRHYVPDALVTAYRETGESPWTDVRDYAEPQGTEFTGVEQDGGTQKEHADTQREQALLFKNSDVIGSPGVLWIEALSETDYFCDPITTPYFPYFLSNIDPEWREPLIESVLSLWPLNWPRLVSTDLLGGASWGPVYPRHGFIVQSHDYKAGAVVAQRAGDITTREYQPHLYLPMREDNPDQGQWPPGEIIEGDEKTHRWQQLIPESESDECRVFPDQSDQSAGLVDPFDERVSEKTGYAFNLWRPYSCCEQEGALLLLDIDLESDNEASD